VALVLIAVANAIDIRDRIDWQQMAHWRVFFLSTTLLVLSIYVPGFNDLIELYPLNGYDWIAVVASMIVHTAVMELIKACLRLRARLLGKKKKPSIFYEDV
jgi:hypothetical protein